MVKPRKLPSGTAHKLKRWRKGHSSDSNPQLSVHRQAARSRYYSRPTEKSSLTLDAVKLHNELQTGFQQKSEDDAMKSISIKDGDDGGGLSERSCGTFLSGLSDCSNITFSKVQRFWQSNSAVHKEICAVLAAVTEVIRSQGGNETETEYFAALMTTMEAVDSSESLAAVAYLLNLVLRRVPGPVLIQRFSDTAKVFMTVMLAQATDTSSALRWVLSCLGTLLRRQDASAWSFPSTMQVYHGLLSFTVHSKPKVRKAAQHGVCSILKGSEFLFTDSGPEHHPAAITTAKFCIKEMADAGGGKEDTTTLHLLGLLKEVLTVFPHSAVKLCCETLLRVMTLSHVLVTAGAMQTFHKLFSGRPSASTLPAELNAQIITALYDYLPSENDLQPLLAWLAVVERAHIHLYSLQNSLCLGHLPRLFSAAMLCLLSPHTQVVSTAAQMLKTLLAECVAPNMDEVGCVRATDAAGSALYIYKMFRTVEEGLTYRFHASWPFVLQILGCFYRVAGKHAHTIMAKSLQSLSELRSTPRFPYFGELDHAVGGAVESMGPEIVLRVIPLQITGINDNQEFPHSWLLPVIRDHVKKTELAYFSSYFLPLAVTLRQRAEELELEGKNLEAKVYQTLQLQIWTMLPGFCTNPTDLMTSFKGIAKALGMTISERPDLRLIVCQALRILILKSCETEEEKSEVGRFTKNFLPILFNVYSQQPPPGAASSRMAVLDTIRIFLKVTPQQLTITFLDKAAEKLCSQENTEFTRLSVMDLIVAMVSHVDEPTLTKIFNLVKPYLQSKEVGMHKKAYRLLEEIFASEKSPCRTFVHANLEELQQVLLGSLKSATSPAKRPRLKCLSHIVKQLTVEHRVFITTLIPEVVICTKEVSVAARKSAYALLVEIGQAFIRFCDTPKEAIEQYLGLVYIGLTNSVTMITCTVLSLTRLVFEFKDYIDVSVMGQLLQNICLLLTLRTREVVKAALGFIKVILFVMDVQVLAAHVTVMMEGIGNLKDDVRRHFRTKLKNIFTKFIRKFGFELVKSMLPEEHHKVLSNIRKAEARTKRRKLMQKAEEEGSESDEDAPTVKGESIEDILAETDSEDSEDDKRKKGQKKVARQKGLAWLKEGVSDEPLNFLDPKVSQRVVATNPEFKQQSEVHHEFKLTSDGRMIICEDDDADKGPGKGGEVEMEDILEEVGVKVKKGEKRSLSRDSMDVDKESQLVYRAGGSGIHRALSAKELGENYKAKKAKGDVKKTGKCDPYAYIPLRKAQLNRRKTAKLQGQFRGIVHGAQKGARKGKLQLKRRKPLSY